MLLNDDGSFWLKRLEVWTSTRYVSRRSKRFSVNVIADQKPFGTAHILMEFGTVKARYRNSLASEVQDPSYQNTLENLTKGEDFKDIHFNLSQILLGCSH